MAADLDEFYALSAALTGYSEFELRGTGVGEQYLEQLRAVAGQAAVDEMVAVYEGARERCGRDQACIHQHLTEALFGSAWLGPLARNVVKMWYVGNWYQLPDRWRDAYRREDADTNRVISAQAYAEGLVWRAAGTHPSGAKEPGYGTWALAPRSAEAG